MLIFAREMRARTKKKGILGEECVTASYFLGGIEENQQDQHVEGRRCSAEVMKR